MYKFKSDMPPRLLSDVERMTDAELLNAAADVDNIFADSAKAQIAWRKRLGIWKGHNNE